MTNWLPFGPVKQYDQANTIAGNPLVATFAWNLAHRPSQIKYATSGTQKTTIDYAEDEKGRLTQKLYSNVTSGVRSDYLHYDWLDRPTCDATTSGSCPGGGSNLKTSATYNSSNDRSTFRSTRYGDYQYIPSYASGKDQLAFYTITGVSGSTAFGWEPRGSRTHENNSASTIDRRDYTYEARRRIRTVSGMFASGFNARNYRITYAYDHKDRLVFRSFVNLFNSAENTTFYYYDVQDRLIEVKHTPSVGNPGTFTIYNFYWLGQRPVAQWATALPGGSTARYFFHTDEANRVLEVSSWPDSGDASIVWALDPDVFGWDSVVASTGIYQPLRLNNLIEDPQTLAWKVVSSDTFVRDRPALLISRGAHYDPMFATTLQQFSRYPDEPYGGGTHRPALGLSRATTPAGSYPGSGGGVVFKDDDNKVPGSDDRNPKCGSLGGGVDFDNTGLIGDSGVNWDVGVSWNPDDCKIKESTPDEFTLRLRFIGDIDMAGTSACYYDGNAGYMPLDCERCVARCVDAAKQATGETKDCFVELCSTAFMQAANACKQADCQQATTTTDRPVCAISCPLRRLEQSVVVPPSLILGP
jgi:hypothetical protein